MVHLTQQPESAEAERCVDEEAAEDDGEAESPVASPRSSGQRQEEEAAAKARLADEKRRGRDSAEKAKLAEEMSTKRIPTAVP